LEADYYERVKEEYKDELGLFGRVEAPKFHDAKFLGGTEAPVGERLENYLNNRLEDYLEDQTILEGIDEEIKQITDGAKNEKTAKKNMK
jgi:hypothetical protein